MHLKRWLTALIGIPLLIIIIGPAPRWLLVLLLSFVSLASLSEFYRITAPDLSFRVRCSCYLASVILLILIFFRQFMIFPVVVTLLSFIIMTGYLFSQASPSRIWTDDIGKAVLGPVYVAIPMALILLIDLNPGGKVWIFFLLVVVFTNDTGAFYFGKLWGRHKLYPKISPHKTWEGAGGGLILSLLSGLIFLRLWPFKPLDFKIIGLIITLSIAAQVGDLAESMIKRNHGIDDSGFMLPGHGGFLDRLDGLLFSIPILYIYTMMTL